MRRSPPPLPHPAPATSDPAARLQHEMIQNVYLDCRNACLTCSKHARTCFDLQEAFRNGPRETVLYVPAIVPDGSRPDYLAVIDVDPHSETYQQVTLRLLRS